MTPSQTVRHYRRCAAACEAKANEASASDLPWAMSNLRMYQNQMVRWLDRYHEAIRAYLATRGARS